MTSDVVRHNLTTCPPPPSSAAMDAALFRDGKLVHQAVTYATGLTGRDLTSSERLAVMAGWRDERSEAVS